MAREAGFDDEDVVHDPNVFAIGTGIEEHAAYGTAFMEAIRNCGSAPIDTFSKFRCGRGRSEK